MAAQPRFHVRARLASVCLTSLVLLQIGYVPPAVSAAEPSPSASPAASATPSAEPSPSPTPSPTVSPSPSPSAAPTDEPEATEPPTAEAERDPATEIVEARTESTRTYDNGDGSRTTELWSDPVFYRPEGSDILEPIEPAFEAVPGADRSVASTAAPVRVEAAPPTDPRGVLRVAAGDHVIALDPLGGESGPRGEGNEVELVVDGPTADIASVFPGVDLRSSRGPTAPRHSSSSTSSLPRRAGRSQSTPRD
jgi:hypothetical protein